MDSATTNPRMIIRESKMKAFQWVAIALCVAMTALDGFDVLSVSYVGPELLNQWNITNTQQANLGTMGIFAMILGSLIFSPVADVIGRRNVLLISLAIIAVGMFASAAAPSYEVLLALRFVTGFGIGTMFAPVNSMAAEFASTERRGVAVGLNVLGYPLGTTVGGLISTWMLADNGPNLSWHSVFILGGVLTTLLIPLVMIFMPESMEFLLSKRPKSALKQVNVFMKKLGHAPLDELPPPDEEASQARGLAQILKQPYLARVIIVIIAYFMTISAFYFANFLTPRALAQIGFDPSTSRLATIAITVGGMLGSLSFGFMAAHIKIQPLTGIVCVLATVMTSVFGLLMGSTVPLMVGAILMGFFINAAIAGFYSGMAGGFPAHLRATGSGFSLGLGRFGAIVGPFVGAQLLDRGFSLGTAYLVVGLPMLVSALVMQFLKLEFDYRKSGRTGVHGAGLEPST